MKAWKNAEIVELNIAETAYGKNLHAKEANAKNGKENNGAGGSLNLPDDGDKAPVTPIDSLS